MDHSNLILLFDENNPFWTEELARLAGEDGSLLPGLWQNGLLQERGGVFSLTEAGFECFRKEAAEWFLPLKPGRGGDPEKELFGTRLRLLIDSKHIQRWGLKEYQKGASFPVPEVSDDELFSLAAGRISWKWPSLPLIERMRSGWPDTGLAARKIAPPASDAALKWLKEAGRTGLFTADLLHLSRYDFQSYTSFQPLPGDRWGLLNADRFFCLKSPAPEAENLEWFLGATGRLQLALEVLRRMVLPGYMDLDSHDQACINWLVFVFEKEAEARECVSLLEPLGLDLIAPAMPMDVWTLSFEALSDFGEKAETIHDLLPIAGNAAARTP
ncbi:MAG: hypothetical protein ACOX5A_03675 [Aminivibrio sp.]|jgi:hypothetical protein